MPDILKSCNGQRCSSGQFLGQGCPTFYTYVVASTSVDYFLRVGKMKFNTQNEEWLGLSAHV